MCRFCASAATPFACFFFQDKRDLKEKKSLNRSRRSDLREPKISGVIKVNCGLHDHSEMKEAEDAHLS